MLHERSDEDCPISIVFSKQIPAAFGKQVKNDYDCKSHVGYPFYCFINVPIVLFWEVFTTVIVPPEMFPFKSAYPDVCDSMEIVG